jgi:nitroreductase/dihydropteridine reductase
VPNYFAMNSPIIEALRWRYATKKFNPTQILEEEKLNILKESFNLTATSYGLQPLKLLVISKPELKKELLPYTMDQMQVVDASHVLVICTETDLNSKYIKDYFNRVEETRDTPRTILAPFESYLVDSFSEKSLEEINLWMAKQAYLAMGNLLTVCALENIDACPIEGFEPKDYDRLLQLEDKSLQSVLVIAVGYRADDDFHSSLKKVRRGVDEVIIDIH